MRNPKGLLEPLIPPFLLRPFQLLLPVANNFKPDSTHLFHCNEMQGYFFFFARIGVMLIFQVVSGGAMAVAVVYLVWARHANNLIYPKHSNYQTLEFCQRNTRIEFFLNTRIFPKHSNCLKHAKAGI